MKQPWLRTLSLNAKSWVRAALGRPDPWKQFRNFESQIHPDTWARQSAILAEVAASYPQVKPDPSPLASALEHRAEVLASFRARLKGSGWRVLIHLPEFGINPAGHSLFRNLGMGLEWIGVPVAHWSAGSQIATHLQEFEPNVLLSIDHVFYRLFTSQPDLIADLDSYRRERQITIGLASNHGLTNGSAVAMEIDAARQAGVGFFFAFQCPKFVAKRYRAYPDHGLPILSLEFAANPLTYHPLPGVKRDIDYVFLASSNAEKWGRYFEYLSRPLAARAGVIIGPGWSQSMATEVSDMVANRLYAKARVGLNLHVPFQIIEPSEINERAYNLAAAGVPQLTDRPALLSARLSEGAVFSAESPDEYAGLFEFALANPNESQTRGLKSMSEVLNNHTVFHRAETLINHLNILHSGRVQ